MHRVLSAFGLSINIKRLKNEQVVAGKVGLTFLKIT